MEKKSCVGKRFPKSFFQTMLQDDLQQLVNMVERGYLLDHYEDDNACIFGDVFMYCHDVRQHENFLDFLIEHGLDIKCQFPGGGDFSCIASALYLIHSANKILNEDEYISNNARFANNVKFYAERGAPLNCQDEDGNTLLHLAIKDSDIDMVSALCSGDVNVNILNNDGISPVMLCIAKNDYQCLALLSKYKIEKINDNQNRNILCIASVFADERVTDLVCDVYGCEDSEMWKTALFIALENNNKSAFLSLAARCPDINVSYNGISLLHYVALKNDVELVRCLLKRGANVHAKTNSGETPLDCAATANAQESYDLILSAMTELNFEENPHNNVMCHTHAPWDFDWAKWHEFYHRSEIISFAAAGVNFENPDGVSRQNLIAKMQEYERLIFVPEPTNPYDSSAIAIVGSAGTVGYVPKDYLSVVGALIGRAALIKGTVKRNAGEGGLYIVVDVMLI